MGKPDFPGGGYLENLNLRDIKSQSDLLDVALKLQQVCRHYSSWPGRQWVLAEQEYPGEPGGGTKGHRSSDPDVIVFDCKTGHLDVRPLNKLKEEKCLYAPLPSRMARTLYVRVEQITPPLARDAPRFRITDHPEQVMTMALRAEIPLPKLSWALKASILFGRIRWVFVLNVTRQFSMESQQSAKTEGTLSSSGRE